MQELKILNNEQISWYKDEDARLDYQLAFEEKKNGNGLHDREEEEQEEKESAEDVEQIDIKALLRKRDRKWKIRLKRAREVAYAEGVEEGRRQGLEQAREEIDEKVEGLEQILDQAHEEWLKRENALNPGLLDLVFDLVETIVGLPVENTEIRKYLDEELSSLLHETDRNMKPVLWICESDYGYVEKLVEQYAPEVTVDIRISEKRNPGEFAFDTDKETVVCDFKEMAREFRENITLPSWK